jgi:O-antigen/teichoic acid export membrane protein
MSDAMAGSGEPDGEAALGRRATAGVLWMTLQKWVLRVGGLVTVAVLTRLLDPTDFGLVAVASTVSPIIMLLTDLGFSAYVVQADSVDQRRLSTGFWFSASAGLAFCAAVVLSAPLLESAFEMPGVAPVIQSMTFPIILVALNSMPVALLRRRMQFRLLSIQGMAASAVAQVVAIVVAIMGFGVWALVLQLAVAQLVSTVLVWRSARWRPSRHFSRAEFRVMAGFGLNVAAVDGVAMLRYWAETAIIAVSLGAIGLGYLSVAQRLVQAVQDMSAAALLPVSTVVFAKVRSSVDRLRDSYLRALTVSYAAVAPLLTMVAVAGHKLVPFLFGDKWQASVPVAQALAIAGIVTLGAMLDNGLYVGTGRPRAWLVYAFLVDGVTVLTTAFAVRYGLTGIALGFIGVAALATVVRWVMVARLLATTVWTVAAPFAKVSVCVALSGLTGWGALWLSSSLPTFATLAVVGIVILGVHGLAVRLTMPGAAREVIRLLPIPDDVARRVSRLFRLAVEAGRATV